MKYFMTHITRISLPTALLLLVGLGLMWLPSFEAHQPNVVILTLLFAAMAATLLTSVFQRVGITRDTDMLPALLYMLAISVFPSLHIQWLSQVVVCVILIVIRVIYKGFREKDTAEDSFLSTLLLLISSLWVPDVIWLVPMVWMGYIALSAFNIRTLLASIIAFGLFVIYLVLSTLLGWYDEPYSGLVHRSLIFMQFDLEEWIMSIAVLCMGIYFFIFTVVRLDRDSLRQRTLLILFTLFFLPQLVVAVYPMLPIQTQPIGLALLTGLATLFFRQMQSLHRGIVFLVYIAMLLAGYFVPTLVL